MAEKTHASLAPSASARWTQCPGSVVFAEILGLPEEDESFFAEEGTAAHEAAEEVISLIPENQQIFDEVKDTISPAIERLRGKVLNQSESFPEGFEVDFEMLQALEFYAEYVAKFINPLDGGVLYVEQSVHLFYSKKESGTADVIGYDPSTRTLHVFDLKYGRKAVYAKDNPQLCIYGIGAYDEYKELFDIRFIHVHIVQPRLNSADNVVYSIAEINEWRRYIGIRAGRAKEVERIAKRFEETLGMEDYDLDGYFVPGPVQCINCRGRARCAKLAQYATKAIIPARIDGKEVSLPVPNDLTTSQLSKILEVKALLVKWLKDVEAYSIEMLQSGVDIEGFKLVRGRRGPKKWVDPEKAEKFVKRFAGEEGFNPRTLRTPTQIMNTMRENNNGKKVSDSVEAKYNKLITQSEGKVNIVPESDKREKINSNLLNDFEDSSKKE